MKLYYTPGSCSLSPHIALREAGLDFDLVKVDGASKKLPDGSDYLRLNAKGYVPCLELDGGERLTEGPAIVQYIADLSPASKLAPPAGTFERARLQEWLSFITSELHKGFSPLFATNTPDDYKPIAKDKLTLRLRLADAALADRPYLLGDTFTVADGYLFVVASWAKYVNVDLSELVHLRTFSQRVAERTAVRAAMSAEGLT